MLASKSISALIGSLSLFVLQVNAFKITSVDIIGSGCTPGTVKYEIGKPSAGLSTLSANFSNFTAASAASSTASQTCGFVYTVEVAPDEQIALDRIVANVTYGGSTDAMLTFQSMYHPQGQVSESTAREIIKGPIAKVFSQSLNLTYAPAIYTPCGQRSVVLSAQIDVKSSNAARGPVRPGSDSPAGEEKWGVLSVLDVKVPCFATRKC